MEKICGNIYCEGSQKNIKIKINNKEKTKNKKPTNFSHFKSLSLEKNQISNFVNKESKNPKEAFNAQDSFTIKSISESNFIGN